MIRRPPRSTLFPTRRSSDLDGLADLFFTANQGSNKLYLNKGGFKLDRISTRLNSSHVEISYAVFCLKKKKKKINKNGHNHLTKFLFYPTITSCQHTRQPPIF